MAGRMAAFMILLLASFGPAASAASWETTVTASSPPAFPNPRPLHAKYGFGWSGFPGATADVKLSKVDGDRLQLDLAAHTIGFVRSLWKFDANHSSIVEGATLHPVEVKQIENVRNKKTVTELSFASGGVTSKVTETPARKAGPKIRRFDFPNLFDLQSGLLYLRSQPLQERSVQRFVVYPATSAYLATVSVLGRERLTVPAGTFNAIKLDLQLSKVGKQRELEPHRKFRRATAWISDDPDRLMLRIEAQIFVGAVFAEMQTVEFDNAKPQANR